MPRLIAMVMIVVLSCTYAAWAMDMHFESFSDQAVAQAGCDPAGADVAFDPDHCSHAGEHLSGMAESGGLTAPAVAPVPVWREVGFSSVLGSPPADPPKA